MSTEIDRVLQDIREFRETQKNTDMFPYLEHLSNTVALRAYVAIAQKARSHMQPEETVVDWGAGFGQMTYFLHALGVRVQPYDVEAWPRGLFKLAAAEPIISQETTKLPFADASVDVLLSCGTLEHVPDPAASSAEVYRVLKSGGRFLIFNLPYRRSPSEYYAAVKGTSVHPLKFTIRGTRKLLTDVGFTAVEVGYHNGLPKNLPGVLNFIRPVYNRFPNVILRLDALLPRVPLLRHMLSNSIYAVARKP